MPPPSHGLLGSDRLMLLRSAPANFSARFTVD
jgi:hypothetical protein